FSATAVNLDAPAGAVATPIEILVERWSTNAERERLITTILESGQDRALEVLQKLPRIGSIRSTTSLGYDLRFAQHTPGSNGTDRIIIMTDRPVGFWEAASGFRTLDYPFTVIEMRIGSNGRGDGRMTIGTKIIADRDTRSIILENYNVQPVALND